MDGGLAVSVGFFGEVAVGIVDVGLGEAVGVLGFDQAVQVVIRVRHRRRARAAGGELVAHGVVGVNDGAFDGVAVEGKRLREAVAVVVFVVRARDGRGAARHAVCDGLAGEVAGVVVLILLDSAVRAVEGEGFGEDLPAVVVDIGRGAALRIGDGSLAAEPVVCRAVDHVCVGLQFHDAARPVVFVEIGVDDDQQ